MNKRKLGYNLLIGIGLLSILILFLIDPIPQDEHYHNFSDQNTIWGIPNFWNVFSNLPFLVVGI